MYLVSVETGAIWEDLLTFLEHKGFGVFAYTEVGNVTIGGTISVGAHGTELELSPDHPQQFRDGSISNLVKTLDAVVWDSQKNGFVLKTFTREDSDSAAFLVNNISFHHASTYF